MPCVMLILYDILVYVDGGPALNLSFCREIHYIDINRRYIKAVPVSDVLDTYSRDDMYI